jgi:hypothetical protein
VEELERTGEPEAERTEDIRLGLCRVDDDPGDRDQRKDREEYAAVVITVTVPRFRP